MSKTRNPDALIRIEDAIKVLCREKCHPGALCPDNYSAEMWDEFEDVERVDAVPVIRCKDCKHNPKLEWFGCPMASLSEKQRPETAWCWKGEREGR